MSRSLIIIMKSHGPNLVLRGGPLPGHHATLKMKNNLDSVSLVAYGNSELEVSDLKDDGLRNDKEAELLDQCPMINKVESNLKMK